MAAAQRTLSFPCRDNSTTRDRRRSRFRCSNHSDGGDGSCLRCRVLQVPAAGHRWGVGCTRRNQPRRRRGHRTYAAEVEPSRPRRACAYLRRRLQSRPTGGASPHPSAAGEPLARRRVVDPPYPSALTRRSPRAATRSLADYTTDSDRRSWRRRRKAAKFGSSCGGGRHPRRPRGSRPHGARLVADAATAAVAAHVPQRWVSAPRAAAAAHAPHVHGQAIEGESGLAMSS